MLKSILLLLITLNLYAELPPYVYEQAKNSANEKIKILVLKVETSIFNVVEQDITITAKVLGIERSKSNLKIDDTIKIFYSRITSRPNGWVGPSQNYPLNKDKKYIAYITKTDQGYYIPDARGKSFSEDYSSDFETFNLQKKSSLENLTIDYQTGDLEIKIYDKYLPINKEDNKSIPVIRRYNSANTYRGMIGKGWSLNFDLKILEFNDDNLVVFVPEISKKVVFKQTKKDRWKYSSTTYNKYITKENDEYILTRINNKCYDKFDKDGKLIYTRIRDQELKYSYSKNKDDSEIPKENSKITIKNNFGKELIIWLYSTNYPMAFLEVPNTKWKYSLTYKLENDFLLEFEKSFVLFKDFYRKYFLEYDKNNKLSKIYEPENYNKKIIKYDKDNKVIEISSQNKNKAYSYKVNKNNIIITENNNYATPTTVIYTYNDNYSKVTDILAIYNHEIIEISFNEDMSIKKYKKTHGLYKESFEFKNKKLVEYADTSKGIYREFKYDKNNNLIEYKNSNGTTKIKYNKSNNIENISQEDGTKVSFEYNSLNKPIKIKIKNYGTIHTTYNENNEVKETYTTNEDGKKIDTYQITLKLIKIMHDITNSTNIKIFEMPKFLK